MFVPKCSYCGGPLYYISNKSLKILSQDNIIDNFFEDIMVGINLNSNNIFPVHIDLYTNNIKLINYTSYHNSDNKNIIVLK
jgi:hypothetical protein